MQAVGVVWRSRLRRGWRAWVVITVLLGLGAGAGLASVAGARRTASSFDRITSAAAYPDIVSSHGLEPTAAAETIEGFEGLADYSTQVGFIGFLEGLDPTLIKYFIGSWDKPLTHGLPALRDGRYPDPERAEEVLLIGRGVDAAGIQPGDDLTVNFFLPDFSDTVTETFVVTGTAADASEVAADASQDRSAIYFTPAFTDVNAARLQAWSSTRFVTAPGDEAHDDLAAQILSVGWSVDEDQSTVQARVQDAIRPLLAALALLGALVLSATLVLVGQAIVRHEGAGRREDELVRALGFTRRQSGLVDLLTVLAVGIPGALLAVATAVVLSPLAPVGTVRRLEPQRGVAADWTVLAWGAFVLVVVLVAGTRLRTRLARRDNRAVARPIRLAAAARGPSMSSGLRLATGGTGAQRRRFWTAVGFSATASTLVVAGIVFVSAVEGLSEDPVRYGAGWDLTARNAYGDISPDELRALLADDTDIEGVSGATLGQVLVGGTPVPALPILPITTALWPTLVDGALPAADDEVLVGAEVMNALEAEIGDVVELRSPYSPPAGAGSEVTIVGTAVFPSVDLPGLDPTRLGQGIAMTWEQYQALDPVFADPLPDFVFFDLADAVDPQAIIDRYPAGMPELTGISATEWLPSLAPAEVLETGRATPLIWTVIALLAVTVLATVGHALASGVRRHRRDYAVLKTLGFTRRQVLSSVTWQSSVTMVLALVIALPVGTALGRGLWQTFVRLVGVIQTTVVPWRALSAVALGAMFATGLVSAGPGLLAARTRPAALLNEE